MLRKIVILVILIGLIGCATPQQRQQATEGINFETNKDRETVIEAIIQVVTGEGFSIDNINEKYGIINCKPNIILTGELMKKVGEPGGGWIATNSQLLHTIEFSATVSATGEVRLKAAAFEEKDENIMSTILQNPDRRRSQSLDVFRTTKLNEYYTNKIKAQLGIALPE